MPKKLRWYDLFTINVFYLGLTTVNQTRVMPQTLDQTFTLLKPIVAELATDRRTGP